VKTSAYALVFAGVILNAAAQLMLKAGANRIGEIDLHAQSLIFAGRQLVFAPPILGGLACYAVSVVLWILALTRVEVSVAYPMLSLGYIVNAFAAWLIFGEALTATRLAGIAAIIVGVCMVVSTGRGA
jgi:multidrug transporter EmrE-like cation transporter